MGSQEFSSKVENTSNGTLDASVTGAIDISDRALRDLGLVDVANAVSVDDSTPIKVSDQSSASPSYKVVSLIADGSSISAGTSASGTASPASGETWIMMGVSYHADVGGGTSGQVKIRANVKAETGSQPFAFAEAVDLGFGYEIFGSGASRYALDGAGAATPISTAANYVLDDGPSGDGQIVFGSAQRIKGVIVNDTDVTATGCRMSAVVRVV